MLIHKILSFLIALFLLMFWGLVGYMVMIIITIIAMRILF